MLVYYGCSIVTLLSAGLGLAVTTRVGSGETKEQKYGALYAVSRSLAMLIVACIPLIVPSVQLSMLTAAMMVVVQAADTYIGLASGRRRQAALSGTAAVILSVLLVLLAF